jgi:dienelactone hydrolase
LVPHSLVAQVGNSSKAEIPAPTGGLSVGRVTYHLIDSLRAEPNELAVGARRELLVHVFYPARPAADAKLTAYFPDIVNRERSEDSAYGAGFVKNLFGSSYPLLRQSAHSYERAPFADRATRYPVVVFSHGGGMPVLYYTALLEDLASHGYVVAAVEHTYDGDVVVFPSGRVAHPRGWDEDDKRSYTEAMAFHLDRYSVGAEDNSFVLTQLAHMESGTLPTSAPSFQGRLEMTQAAAVGHSLGGIISFISCSRDSRWKACVNLNGGLDSAAAYATIKQPILQIDGGRMRLRPQGPQETAERFAERKRRAEAFDEQVRHTLKNALAASYIVHVGTPGFSHFSFFDQPNGQVDRLPPAFHPPRGGWESNTAIIRRYVLAFLDHTLRGAPAGLIRPGQNDSTFVDVEQIRR